MEFKLAETLSLPVSAMKAVVTTSEFNGWIKYFNQKPPDIQEVQLAVISTLISSAAGGKGKVKDFILSGKNGKVKPKDPNELANQVASAFRQII